MSYKMIENVLKMFQNMLKYMKVEKKLKNVFRKFQNLVYSHVLNKRVWAYSFMKFAQNDHPTRLFGPIYLFGTWKYYAQEEKKNHS